MKSTLEKEYNLAIQREFGTQVAAGKGGVGP